MKIRIRIFAKVKDISEADSFPEYSVGSSIRELLNAPRERPRKLEDQLFSKDGVLHNHLVLVMNGARIYEENIDSFALSGGDGITRFSSVSGGGSLTKKYRRKRSVST